MKYLLVTVIVLLICLLPYLLNIELAWSFLDDDEREKVVLGFESVELKVIICGCISTSVPIMLDIIKDFINSRRDIASYMANIGSSMLLFVVVVPDLVSLIYIFPKKDIRLFIVIDGCGNIAIFACFIFYIFRVGDDSWKSIFSWTIFLVGLSGFAIQIWAPFVSKSLYFIGDCLLYLAIFLLTIKSCRLFWNQYQRWQAGQILKISMNEYSCNIYVIMALLFLYITIILRFCFQISEYSIFNSSYIIAQNIMCASLFIIISTFEREVVIQETIVKNELRVKRMYVRYISHEVRTPLNAVNMGLQYLITEASETLSNASADLLDSLITSKSACSKAIGILDDLLLIDSIEDGRLPIFTETVSAKEIIEDSLTLFTAQARQKDVHFNWNLFSHTDDDLARRVLIRVDKKKFGQVINNLVSNAIKFTPSGGSVTVTAAVRPDVFQNKERLVVESLPQRELVLEVQDTGAGLSQADVQLLFTKIVQFHPEKLQAGGGSGLGLFLSKSIMNRLGGTIAVRSEGEGKGSVFTVTLPVEDIAFVEDESCFRGTHEQHGDEGPQDLSMSSTDEIRMPASPFFIRSTRVSPRSSVGCGAKAHPTERRVSSINTTTFRDSVTMELEEKEDLCKDSEESSGNKKGVLHMRGDGGVLVNRMLVVDDAISNRKMLCRLLKRVCVEQVEAEDGEDALEKVQESISMGKEFDVILMDFVMPKKDGPSATKALRIMGYTGLIVGITGNALGSDIEYFQESGADYVTTKPLNVAELVAVIRHYAER